jgi:small GTP-binding protein
MDDEDEDNDVCKVVLLGESGVGKTSIISRFINGTFENNLMATNGASYICRNLEFPEYQNRILKFEIWDTAGQEQYRALNKLFYKDASICILVYDITNAHSFNALKDYWHQQLKDYGPKNIILGLVANKSDLYNEEEIPEENARNFAKEINAFFSYTSASKFTGIDELFHNIGCKYIDPNFKSEDCSLEDVKKQINSNDNKQNTINKKEEGNKHKNKDKIKLDNSKHSGKNKKNKKFC